MYIRRGFARPTYRVVIVYLSPFNSPFPSLIIIFCFPCPTSISHPITPDQPRIHLSSSLVSIMSIPIVTTPPALRTVNSLFPMEPQSPQDRVVDENSLESLLEVPADINHVKDLFWRVEDLSSFRPTPQQWHNQYFPLLNVYTQRMKHKPNKQGVYPWATSGPRESSYEDEQKEQEDTEDGREAEEEATDDECANVED